MKDLAKQKKIELKNTVVLSLKITSDYQTEKDKDIKLFKDKIVKEKNIVRQEELVKELKNIEKDKGNILKLRGQWEGLNLITLKFHNKKQFHYVKKIPIGQLITVKGKIYNFFNNKEHRTFATIIVESYKKIC